MNPEPCSNTSSRAICTLATGRHQLLLAESEPTLREYASHWKWDVHIERELLSDRPASWSKVVLLQRLLHDHEFVLWIDADALFVDITRDILSEVNSLNDVWFAHHPQEYDPSASVPNAGVVLIRSSPFTTALLDEIWAQEQYIDHNWWENAALLHLLGYSLDAPFPLLATTPWQERVGRLDLAWNSVPGYCESSTPAINHHARSDHDNFDRRLKAMRRDRQALLGDPDS